MKMSRLVVALGRAYKWGLTANGSGGGGEHLAVMTLDFNEGHIPTDSRRVAELNT